MIVRIEPRPLKGIVRAIPSKSDAHRLMIAQHLSGGTPCAAYGSGDLLATESCLRALRGGKAELDCGESGSTLRFLLPVAAALGRQARFTGRGRLPQRPLFPITEELRRHGVRVSGDRLPLSIEGRLTPGEYRLPGDVSSQFVTGLLFALPLLDGDSSIVLTSPLESGAYVEMTLRTLQRSAIAFSRTDNGFHVPGRQVFRCPQDALPEGDWSNAAFFLCAGRMSGTQIGISGLDSASAQSDRAIERILRENESGQPLSLDVRNCPDLFPVLTVLAASCRGTSVFSGGSRLRIKESDRIQAMKDTLLALGGKAEETADGLAVFGCGRLRGGTVDGKNDHRVVMAAAAAACICREPVEIAGAEAVEKSYPDFFRDYNRLGGCAYGV
ncbi:MAG: 3-phosphoshikimate 1-carboxyvinyltransferase [Clostridia bacterium]|nr:3-phosphoshikimate 1-carboxyvinyltransferase [Clostridia bacterium]